jgi:hypothetical protein
MIFFGFKLSPVVIVGARQIVHSFFLVQGSRFNVQGQG